MKRWEGSFEVEADHGRVGECKVGGESSVCFGGQDVVDELSVSESASLENAYDLSNGWQGSCKVVMVNVRGKTLCFAACGLHKSESMN